MMEFMEHGVWGKVFGDQKWHVRDLCIDCATAFQMDEGQSTAVTERVGHGRERQRGTFGIECRQKISHGSSSGIPGDVTQDIYIRLI